MSKHFGRDVVLTIDGKVIGVLTHVEYNYGRDFEPIVVGFICVGSDESEKRQEWYDREEENESKDE